jgi:glycosyltransferase involved in cell wall biosynthesis
VRIAVINDIASVGSEIGAGLRARGHTVDFYMPRLVGARLHPHLKPITAPIRALDWLDLIRRLRAGRYDLVHIHYAYLGNVGALGHFPYLLHCHGSDVRDLTAVSRPLAIRAIRHANHVFYATPDLAPAVTGWRPDAEFLPNPIDTAVFAPRTPPSTQQAAWIACALTKVKGAGQILQACRILADAAPGLLIGATAGGEYTEAFRRLPNVILYARQPRGRLPAVIDRHGIVIGQVRVGSAGMAELEAMACGRPVVMRFEHDDAYSEPPPFVNAADPEAIAGAVLRLAADPAERDRLGEAGRAWIVRHHGLDHIVDRVEAVAAAVARGEPIPPAPPA